MLEQEFPTDIRDRVTLAQKPTPIHPLPRISSWLERDIWIKRDDLTGLELSGNKVRKLEYLLADALASGANLLITCGGAQSNHARATALAGRRFGMQTRALLRGHEELEIDGNLFLLRLCGAEVRWCTPEAYGARNQIMLEMAEEARRTGFKPYIIPEGGSNALGALSYARAMEEIRGQSEALSLNFDTIVCAVGSGGTLAGMTAGAAFMNSPPLVMGFNVCDSAEYFENIVDDLLVELATMIGLNTIGEQRACVVDGFVGPGYAMSGDGDHRMIVEMATREGLILDPAYTAKAFFGLSELIRQNDPRVEGRILFLHSGGAFGLFPHRASFSRELRTDR